MSAEKVLEFKAKCEHGWTGSPSRCKDCRRSDYNARKQGVPDLRKNVILTENGRVCNKCEKTKSWDEFSKDMRGYNQKNSICRECRNNAFRNEYKDNPAVRRLGGIKIRQDKLKRVYGITYADVVRTFDKQLGRCANRACGKEISLEVKGTSLNRAVIDHCHKTGKFRALLCSPCNTALGVLESKENIVLGLMDYISKYK